MLAISFGAGGIKAIILSMGVDQFDSKYPQDMKELQQFISYSNASNCVAAFVAYSFFAYVCQNGLPFLGDEDWGCFVGHIMPTIMMCFGVAVFAFGSNKYKKVRPSGSVLAVASGILYEALITRFTDTSPGQRNFRNFCFRGCVRIFLFPSTISNAFSLSSKQFNNDDVRIVVDNSVNYFSK
jgi:hypothetical protein